MMEATIRHGARVAGKLQSIEGRSVILKLFTDKKTSETVYFVLEQYLEDLGFTLIKNAKKGASGIKNKEYHKRQDKRKRDSEKEIRKTYPLRS